MPVAATLIGRDAELQRLSGVLDEVRDGASEVVLVHGEAGIGKTSLVEALVSSARERDLHAAWGRCWERGAAPIWPWVQVLCSVAAVLDDDDDLAVGAGVVSSCVPNALAPIAWDSEA